MGGPCTRTPSGTPTLRTCWKAEPTCGRARAARPRRPRHDPDLHPPHPRTPAGGLRGNPSPCLTTRPPSPKPTPLEVVAALWRRLQGRRRRRGRARAPDPPLLAAGEVRRRPRRRRAAAEHRAGRPRELRDLRAHRRDRQVRSRHAASSSRPTRSRRIKGAIIDELRSIDWVPRSVRSKARSIERAYSKLENELKRTPEDAEVAAELGVTEPELAPDALARSASSARRARRAAERGGAAVAARPSATRSPTR